MFKAIVVSEQVVVAHEEHEFVQLRSDMESICQNNKDLCPILFWLVSVSDTNQFFYARLTQLEECFPYKEEVVGSSPSLSTKYAPVC